MKLRSPSRRGAAGLGPGGRLSAWFLGTLFLLAALAPFLANEVPLLLRTREGLELPVLRTFGALDALWTGAAAGALLLLLSRLLSGGRLSRLLAAGAGALVLGGTLAWAFAAEPANLAVVDWKARTAEGGFALWPPVDHGWRDQDVRAGAHFARPGGLEGHPLGTDRHGRDVLARLIHGTRVSLMVGLLTVMLSLLVGVAVGAVAGYARGRTDALLSALVQIFMCFPVLFTVLAVQAVLPPSIAWVVLLLGLTRWTGPARLVRGEVLRLREEDFVAAARAQGLRPATVVLRHLVPHTWGPVLVNATFGVGAVVLLESTLSFLGLGVPPPTPSWGEMLAQGRDAGVAHLVWLPGLLVFLTVLAFSVLGEGLRERQAPGRTGREPGP